MASSLQQCFRDTIPEWIEQNTQRFDHWIEGRSTKKGPLQKNIDVYKREVGWFNMATIATITFLCLSIFGGGGILASLAFFSLASASYLGRVKIGQLLDVRWRSLQETFRKPVLITKNDADAVWEPTLKKDPWVPNIEFLSITLFKSVDILNWPEPKHVDSVIAEGKRRL